MQDGHGFLLSRHWRDTRQGVELEFWLTGADGPVQLIVPRQQVVFFLADNDCETAIDLLSGFSRWHCKPVAMRNFSMEPVQAFYFNSQRTLREARELLLAHKLSPLEADISPHQRFLMERFIRGSVHFRAEKNNNKRQCFQTEEIASSEYQPVFNIVSLDIETAMEGLQLYSIAVYSLSGGEKLAKVFMVGEQALAGDVEVFATEKQLMIGFLDWLSRYDPDIIIGWNVVNFDCWYLQRICDHYQLPFRLGRQRGHAHWRVLDDEGDRRALSAPGRVIIDGIELLKAAAYRFDSFALNNVALQLLDSSKLLEGDGRGEQITELFLADKQTLAEYNLQDCKLVWDIFGKTKLIDFAVARTRLTGLPLERISGSVASFDFRYLPQLHRQGFVAPNGHLAEEVESSPGGFVMNSKPGIYNNVLVLDFKSLYPSIIRTFKIDPLGLSVGTLEDCDQSDLVPGFKGAWFSREKNILPALIAELWQSRDEAKAVGNAALSQAIKILMNSFYGVLGSGGCRFFDARLASSITQRGHQIIQQTARFIEKESLLSKACEVIYGDTDSVFVWLKKDISRQHVIDLGKKLEKQLNGWWCEQLKRQYAIESALEIEFETHYHRFLMPKIRGSEQGSKKRYAGVIEKNGQREIIFKGLESVRSDWTLLAKSFQSELYRRVFFEESYRDFVKSTVQEVLAGQRDAELIYRKRLRRRLQDYQRISPPHVQAARKAQQQAGTAIKRGDWIEYIITVSGPEPVGLQLSKIDYQHYIDRQLAPVADGILCFLSDSLAAIIDQQLGLFE